MLSGGKKAKVLARNRLKKLQSSVFSWEFYEIFQKICSAKHNFTAASVRASLKITLTSYDRRLYIRPTSIFVKVTHKLYLVLNAFLIKLQSSYPI